MKSTESLLKTHQNQLWWLRKKFIIDKKLNELFADCRVGCQNGRLFYVARKSIIRSEKTEKIENSFQSMFENIFL